MEIEDWKSVRQWALEAGISVRKAQRWRKTTNIGILTPDGYMLTPDEWAKLVTIMPAGDGRRKKIKLFEMKG